MFLDRSETAGLLRSCRINPEGNLLAMVDKDEIPLNSKEVAEIPRSQSRHRERAGAQERKPPGLQAWSPVAFQKRRRIISYKRESWSATAA